MKVSITAKKVVILMSTMAVAVAMVACQAAVAPKPPPAAAEELGDIEFDVGGSAKTIQLAGAFQATNPTYTAFSSDPNVAAVSVSGAALKVTPGVAGTADVTVKVKGDNGDASQIFEVTVKGPSPNKPPTVRTISPVSLQDDGQKMIRLSDYFTDPEGDALTYTASSSMELYATAAVEGATLTITAVAAGTAEITVSASDGTNDAVSQTFDVMVSETPPPNERPEQTLIADINDLRREGTRDLDLSMYYDDPDGDELTYDATSSDEMVVTESVSGSMLTITGFGVGRARITVIASDGTDDVRQTFSVTVGSQAPVVDESLPTSFPLGPAGATKVLNLSKYYDDPESDELTYDATSSDKMVVTESVSGSMLTITAVAPGVAVVTATATDRDNDPVTLEFGVTVVAPPVVNKRPRVSAMVDNKSLVVGDTTEPLTLSMYFTDPDEGDTLLYSARSSDDTIARVTAPDVVDHTITITAVGVGEAVIAIGATDNHEASTEATFTVTVGPAPVRNMPPRLKVPLGPFKGVVNGFENIDLDAYFEDPDGNDAFITYKVTQDKEKENQDPDPGTSHNVIAVGTGTVSSNECNNGMDGNDLPGGNDFRDEVWICYLALGTAEMEIVAIDALGDESRPFPVMIEVGKNKDPEVVGDTPDQIGDAGTNHTKLVIGIERKVINDVTFATYFEDNDLDSDGDEDMLTFEVKYYKYNDLKQDDDTSTIMAANALKMGDPGYGAVSATIIPSLWNGTTGAKFTLELTGEKGTDKQTVALIARDTYGGMAAMVFAVSVNHDPMAYGAQEDEGNTLSSETKYQGKNGLTVPAVTDDEKQTATATLVLVEKDGGYFSDGDGAGDLSNKDAGSGAGCVITATSGTEGAATFTITEPDNNRVSLEIRAKKIGAKNVTILCKDTFGVKTPHSTLTVEVTGQVTGSRQ